VSDESLLSELRKCELGLSVGTRLAGGLAGGCRNPFGGVHICLSGGEQEYWSGRERSHPYWRGKEPWTFPPPIDSQYCLSAVGTCRMRGTKLFWPFLFTSDSGAPPVEQEFPPCEDWALQREALTLEEE